MSIASGKSLLASVAQSISLFATAAGIEIAAQEGILLTSGGAYIRIKDGDIEIHAPGTIDIKGAKKTLSGPTQLNRNHPAWPESSVTQA
ncbi:hypothetical protein A248_02699, partial [Pseudomonas syringae pv. actinidiae ICMP 19100]